MTLAPAPPAPKLERISFSGRIHWIRNDQDLLAAAEDLNRAQFLGFDTETKPSFKKGDVFNVALLQLATETEAYVIQLHRISQFQIIKNIFENEAIAKVGVAIRDDLKALQKTFPFTAKNFIELQDVAKEKGLKNFGLKGMTEEILQLTLSKGQKLSNWEAPELTQPQLLYAATDAWIGLMLYQRMTSKIHSKSLVWSDSNDETVPLIRPYVPTLDFLESLQQSQFILADVQNLASNFLKIRKIMGWTHQLWSHDGGNDPGLMDPTVILNKARTGEKFRCVEFSIITASVAWALSMPGRVVGLRTKDVETAESGAGHVVAEIFSREFNKWIMVDSQMSLIPIADGLPLNAFEFAKAASDHKKIQFMNETGDIRDCDAYLDWIVPYLHYVAFRIDQRYDQNSENLDQIILVPQGSKVPQKFQNHQIPGRVFAISSPRPVY